MRIPLVLLSTLLLTACGLGYTHRGVSNRPDRATGVGAAVIYPGEAPPPMRSRAGSGSGSGNSQSSSSSSPTSQSGSSRSSGGTSLPEDENMTMIGGHAGSSDEDETYKEGPAFLPLFGYPFWWLGKSLQEKADEAVEKQGNPPVEAEPELPEISTPDDAERERLRRENARMREQLSRRGANRSSAAPTGGLSLGQELAALQRTLEGEPTAAPPRPTAPGTGAAPPVPLPPVGAVAPPPAAETADRDGDGRPDVWTYTEQGRRVREALDDDHDGRVDRIHHFDAESRLVRDEEDRDGDGVLETVSHYRDGHLARRRTDADGDGVIDAWTFYRLGELLRHEVDRDGDGFRDLVMSYAGGDLVREEEDRNGDGRPDRVTVYRAGEVVEKLEDLDFDGTTDLESYYENGKLVRRNATSERALEEWSGRAGS